MAILRTAVIGVGYLGKFHAQKYANITNCQLVAVCDTNIETAQEIANQLGCEAISHYEQLIGKVDAVSVVAPTPLHHEIGLFFLKNNIHVLLEKPISVTLEEADELITVAKQNNVLLQIGHLERFNNAIKALEPSITAPLFIESTRVAPFKLRGTDVNVVLDVMIHDIDLIQSLVKSEIKEIRANGAPVVSPKFIDIANARIEFESGCVANVTASRVSLKSERKMRIFQRDCYASLDLEAKKLAIHRKGTKEMFPGFPAIDSKIHQFDKGDAIFDEIVAFIDSIENNKPAVVTGEDGKRALETAILITKIMRAELDKYQTMHSEDKS